MNKRRGSFGSGIAATSKLNKKISLIPMSTIEQMTGNAPITVVEMYGQPACKNIKATKGRK